MNPQRPNDNEQNTLHDTITRRRLLAASGVIAVGGLAGCLDRVTSRVTNTGASPAAVFAGNDDSIGEPHVARLTPTISGGSGLLSSEVELEAWVTAIAMEDYNSPRSNRTIANPDVDSDDDGVDDGLGDRDYNDVLAAALDLENTLLSQTKAAADSISKRSARTGRSQLSEMSDTIGEVQATLESCSDDVCVTVRENADVREKLVGQAQGHVENGEWDDAAVAVEKVRDIVEGDIERLEDYNSTRSNRSIANPDVDSDDDGVDDGVEDGVGDDNDVRGENYNSTRSNRSIARPSDLFDDDIDEDDETFRGVLRLDARLQEATTAAATAISKRSARTGPNPETEKEITAAVSEMETVLTDMRAVLERCSNESCVAALANVADRQADVRRAQEYAENGEWEAFGLTDGDGNDILVGDYLLPPPTFDPSGMFSSAEQAALFRYFEGTPVIGERFTVCLPDAEVPGGNGSIREEVTPERLFAYLAGQEVDENGKIYAWGYSEVGSGNSGDCDDDDPSVRPGAVCGSSPHFVADVSEPVATGGGLLAARGADGHVVVTNTPPTVTDGASAMVCPAEREPFEPAGLDAWGKRAGGPPATMEAQGRLSTATVVQVMVQPSDCPQPIPALLYVSRGLSDGQLIYSGGWVIDDAALYKDSMTALSMAGETQVVGIECCFDFTNDGEIGDVLSRAVSGERARRGARGETGSIESLVKAGVMSEDGGGKLYAWGSNEYGKNGSSSDEEDSSGDGEFVVTHRPLDAPVLHLVNAGDASESVKFKTGAELSKSVN